MSDSVEKAVRGLADRFGAFEREVSRRLDSHDGRLARVERRIAGATIAGVILFEMALRAIDYFSSGG